MAQADRPVWGFREYHEHLGPLSGQKVNLRKALSNIDPLRSIFVMEPLADFSPTLIEADMRWKRMNKKLTAEYLNYPSARYETESLSHEFTRRRLVLERSIVGQHLVDEFGIEGHLFLVTHAEPKHALVTLAPNRSLTPSEIDALLKYSSLSIHPRFSRPGIWGFCSTDIAVYRTDEGEPDIYELHGYVPDLTQTSNEDLYSRNYFSDDAPVIVNALQSALVSTV